MSFSTPRRSVCSAHPLRRAAKPPSVLCGFPAYSRPGARVIIPEIADYEVRRELIRAGKASSIARLDALAAATNYLPLSTAAMRKAAELWAAARKAGKPTATEKAIDGDVILAAQALTLGEPSVVVATTNVGHLSRFVTAQDWKMVTS